MDVLVKLKKLANKCIKEMQLAGDNTKSFFELCATIGCYLRVTDKPVPGRWQTALCTAVYKYESEIWAAYLQRFSDRKLAERIRDIATITNRNLYTLDPTVFSPGEVAILKELNRAEEDHLTSAQIASYASEAVKIIGELDQVSLVYGIMKKLFGGHDFAQVNQIMKETAAVLEAWYLPTNLSRIVENLGEVTKADWMLHVPTIKELRAQCSMVTEIAMSEVKRQMEMN